MAADDPNQVGDLPAHDWGGDGNNHKNINVIM